MSEQILPLIELTDDQLELVTGGAGHGGGVGGSQPTGGSTALVGILQLIG